LYPNRKREKRTGFRLLKPEIKKFFALLLGKIAVFIRTEEIWLTAILSFNW